MFTSIVLTPASHAPLGAPLPSDGIFDLRQRSALPTSAHLDAVMTAILPTARYADDSLGQLRREAPDLNPRSRARLRLRARSLREPGPEGPLTRRGAAATRRGSPTPRLLRLCRPVSHPSRGRAGTAAARAATPRLALQTAQAADRAPPSCQCSSVPPAHGRPARLARLDMTRRPTKQETQKHQQRVQHCANNNDKHRLW